MCYKIIIKIIIAVVFNTEKEKQLRGGGTELRVFKACVRYFLSNFFHQMIALQKLRKMFFISSKKLFSFFEIFKFLYFRLPLFFAQSAITLEVDPRKI